MFIDISRHNLEATLSFIQLKMEFRFQITAGSKDPKFIRLCTLCIFIASSKEGQNLRTCQQTVVPFKEIFSLFNFVFKKYVDPRFVGSRASAHLTFHPRKLLEGLG